VIKDRLLHRIRRWVEAGERRQQSGHGDAAARQGSVLIVVLIVVATLTAIASGLAYRTRLDIRMTQAAANRTQAYYLALGGLERVHVLVSEQDLTPARIAWLCRFTGGAEEERLFEDLPEGDERDRVSPGQLAYSLRDEQAYLDINGQFADRFETAVGREWAARILDWIDQDDDPLGREGAETDFYQQLNPPYFTKNKPLLALRELLFLKGASREAYAGKDPNRNGRLDPNEKDGLPTSRRDNDPDTLDLGLIDFFTVRGNDRINLNTASPAVLASIGGLDAETAEWIDAYRAGRDRRYGTEDDQVFTKPEDVPDGVLPELQTRILRDTAKFGFDSRHFRVFSCAQVAPSAACCLMASIDCNESEPAVVFVERLF